MTPQTPHNPPAPRKSRGCLYAAIAAAVAALLLAGSCGLIVAAVGTGADPAATSSPPDAGDDGNGTKRATVGETAKDGNFSFTVTEVKTGPSQIGGPYGAEAQGKYIYVHVTVENHGDQARTFDSSSQVAHADGKEYQADGEAGIYLGDSEAFLNDINPGNSVDGTLIFDVPKDVELTSVTLHDSAFSGGVRVRLS